MASMSKLPSEIISLNLHFKQGIEDMSIGYFNYVFTLFELYKNHGVLPYPGSASEQPAKIIEIFDVLQALTSERDRKLMEEQKRELAKKKNKRGR